MKAGIAVISLVVGLSASLANADSWKFVVYGDTRSSGSSVTNGVNVAALGDLANATVSEGAEFALVVGDLAYSGGSAAFTQWKTTMAPVYNAGIGVYVIRGNHDYAGNSSSALAAWNDAFGASLPANGPAGEVGLTYSFTRHNALIVGVDEYVTSHRVNQTWLDAQFAANNQPNVFVFGHEPAFKANHTDCLDDYVPNRDAFWNSIAAEGGRTYFCGHDHFYDQAGVTDGDGNTLDDVHQVLIGNGGAPYYNGYSYNGLNSTFSPVNLAHDENTYGYMLVEVNDLDVTITYKHRDTSGAYVAYGSVFSYTAVPEPATLAVLAMGALGLLRRKRS